MFLSSQTQKLTPCTRNRVSAPGCDADFCSLPSACVRELDLAHLTRGEQLCVRACADACKHGLFSQPKSKKKKKKSVKTIGRRWGNKSNRFLFRRLFPFNIIWLEMSEMLSPSEHLLKTCSSPRPRKEIFKLFLTTCFYCIGRDAFWSSGIIMTGQALNSINSQNNTYNYWERNLFVSHIKFCDNKWRGNKCSICWKFLKKKEMSRRVTVKLNSLNLPAHRWEESLATKWSSSISHRN